MIYYELVMLLIIMTWLIAQLSCLLIILEVRFISTNLRDCESNYFLERKIFFCPCLVLEECQTSWKAIIVDEFQDTSAMQYVLLRLLVSHGQITIVGDDDQVNSLLYSYLHFSSIISLFGLTLLKWFAAVHFQF